MDVRRFLAGLGSLKRWPVRVNEDLLMTHTGVILALASLLSPQPNGGGRPLPEEGREMFRRAVAQYQIFVVPHCAPYVVRAYANARAERDRLFVQSLHGTELEADYVQAVADEARLDSQRVYECGSPPLPPPKNKEEQEEQPPPRPTLLDTWASHATEGDKQFAAMVRIRDSLLGSPQK